MKDNLKIYPLSMADNPPEPEFISMSGREDYNAVPPNDYSYWEMLNQLVQEEPIGAHDPETRGLLAALGIAKGEPFATRCTHEGDPDRCGGHRQRLCPCQHGCPQR